MLPHYALKGVGRPLHCHVLKDDTHGTVTPDQLQLFTYELCYLYARATKIVSKPAPVYYAHVAAKMGPFYNRGYREVSDSWETRSVTSQGSGSAGSGGGFAEVSPAIRSTGYFL